MSKNKKFYFNTNEFQVEDGLKLELKCGRIRIINKETDDRVEAIEDTLGHFFKDGFDMVHNGEYRV